MLSKDTSITHCKNKFLMYWNVAAVMHYISCVLLNIGLYFLFFFAILGSICMYCMYFV